MGSFSSKGRMYQTQGGISPRTKSEMTEEFGSANVSEASRDALEKANEESAGADGGRPVCATSHDNSLSNRNAYLWLMSTPIVVHATWKEQKERIPSSVHEGRRKHSTLMKGSDSGKPLIKSGQQCPTSNAAASSASQHRNSISEDDGCDHSAMKVDQSSRNDYKVDNSATGVSSLTGRGYSCGFGVKN